MPDHAYQIYSELVDIKGELTRIADTLEVLASDPRHNAMLAHRELKGEVAIQEKATPRRIGSGLDAYQLTQQDIDHLIARSEELPSSELVVDLETQTVSTADGSFTRRFEIDPFVKHCLLEGLDDIGLTMQEAEAIERFEASRREILPRTVASA